MRFLQAHGPESTNLNPRSQRVAQRCWLFERRPRGIRLTADGEYLLPKAEGLVCAVSALLRDMRSRGRGRPAGLRVGHFGTFLALYLAPFLERVRRRHPRWQIELVEHVPADALARLGRGELDAATTGRPEAGRLQGFESRVIWRQAPLIALASAHPLAKRRRLQLRDLANERLLVWDEALFPGFGLPFLAACRSAGFEPQGVRGVDDVANALAAVARDGSVTYVGRLAGQMRPPGSP